MNPGEIPGLLLGKANNSSGTLFIVKIPSSRLFLCFKLAGKLYYE